MSNYKIETKCVQGGYTPGNGEPRQIPIVQSTTFHYDTSEDMAKLFDLEASGYFYSRLQNPAVIVDTNHANSGKQCLEQVRIAKEVLHACRHSADVKKIVKGLMIESYIEDGAQKIGPDEIYGKSITDPCLGWEKTERLIYDIADVL